MPKRHLTSGPATGRRAALRAKAGCRTGRDARDLRAGARSRTAARHDGRAAHPHAIAMKHAMRKSALRDCGQRCVYCAVPLDARSATLDHVYPLARGGAHDFGNVVSACAPCNRLKGDLLPHEFFARHPWAGQHFLRYARSVHRALKRIARRAVSLAFAAQADRQADRLAAERSARDGRAHLAA
jgi:5-methylcytosine-specific restriction endonuclease McrA